MTLRRLRIIHSWEFSFCFKRDRATGMTFGVSCHGSGYP